MSGSVTPLTGTAPSYDITEEERELLQLLFRLLRKFKEEAAQVEENKTDENEEQPRAIDKPPAPVLLGGAEPRKTCNVFVRIKDISNIDPVTESVDVRWRYFLYFKDEKLRNLLFPQQDQIPPHLKEYGTLGSREYPLEYREYVHKIPKDIDVMAYVPVPSVSNRRKLAAQTEHDKPELIWKSELKKFCYTEQVTATLKHQFSFLSSFQHQPSCLSNFVYKVTKIDYRRFLSFFLDKQEIKIDFRINKPHFRDTYDLKIGDDDDIDDKREHIPYYKYNDDEDDKLAVRLYKILRTKVEQCEKEKKLSALENDPQILKTKEQQIMEEKHLRKLTALELDARLLGGGGADFEIWDNAALDSSKLIEYNTKHKPRAEFTIPIVIRVKFSIQFLAGMQSLIASLAFLLIRFCHPKDRFSPTLTILFTTITFSMAVGNTAPKLPSATYTWTLHTFFCVALVVTLLFYNAAHIDPSSDDDDCSRGDARRFYFKLSWGWGIYHFLLWFFKLVVFFYALFRRTLLIGPSWCRKKEEKEEEEVTKE